MSVQLARLETRVGGLESRDKENRRSIHEVRNGQEEIQDSIHALDIKFARLGGYAVGAGSVVALIVKLIDHLWR